MVVGSTIAKTLCGGALLIWCGNFQMRAGTCGSSQRGRVVRSVDWNDRWTRKSMRHNMSRTLLERPTMMYVAPLNHKSLQDSFSVFHRYSFHMCSVHDCFFSNERYHFFHLRSWAFNSWIYLPRNACTFVLPFHSHSFVLPCNASSSYHAVRLLKYAFLISTLLVHTCTIRWFMVDESNFKLWASDNIFNW